MKPRRKTLNKIVVFIKLIITLFAISVVFFILEKNYAFFGTKSFSYDFKEDNYFISHLEPWERLSKIQTENDFFFQEIKDEAVYFNVKKPGDFQTIEVSITYQNPAASIFDIGLRVNNNGNYTKLPLEAKLIENLTWDKIQNGDVTLFQKKKEFNSVDDFIASFPKEKKVIAHNFDLKKHVSENNLIKENITPLRTNADLDGIDYLITEYTNPTESNGWKKSSATFNFKNAYIDEDEMIRFMLTAPGLKENGGVIKIKQIDIIFKKPPLTKDDVILKIRKFFKI